MRFENYIKTKAFSQNGKAFLLPSTTGDFFGATCVWQSVAKFAKIDNFGYGHLL